MSYTLTWIENPKVKAYIMKLLSHSHILQLPDSPPQRQPTLLFSSRDFKANICLHLCVYMYSFSSIQIAVQHTWYLSILNFYLNNTSWDHPAYYIPSSYFFFLAELRSLKDLSSLTRDWSLAPCFGVWSLSHWTTKEAPDSLLLLLISLPT